MKNKLLMTTALIGTVALAGAAQSESKISGSSEVTFNASSVKNSTAALNGLGSGRGTGAETNISYSGSKDLDNGMKVGAKFNFEMDQSLAREYQVTFGQGDVYFAIGSDMTQGLNSISAPRVGDHPSTVASSAVTTSYTDGYIENNNDDHLAIGINNVAGGSLVAIYAPNASRDSGDSTAGSAHTTGSGWEVTYKGSPVEGLSVGLGYAEKQAAVTTTTKDMEATKVMVAYTMGAVTAGVEFADVDDPSATQTRGAVETMSYGLTYNAADNLSVGLGYAKTKDETAGGTDPDEKIKLITLGYNLGGLGIELSYADTDNAGNSSGVDTQAFQARTVLAF
jgi:hypothetical protein